MCSRVILPPSLPPSPTCWFSSNNSETVKAVTFFQPFFSIQEHFIRKVRAKFGIPYLRQCPEIGQISDWDIFDFRISCQSLIEWNCYNSRTSDDIDKELEPVTKIDKKNKTRSKKTWQWRHIKKLWRHCYFSNLQPIWSNPEAGFWMHSL